MRLDVDADERFWAHLPGRFPSDRFGDRSEWERDVVARALSLRPEVDPVEREAIAAVAARAADELLPSALFGLLFWPAPGPAAVLVHVEVAPPLRATDDPLRELLDDVPTALPPSIESVEIPGVGAGVSARFVLPGPDGERPVAGLGYVVSGDRGAVRVTSSPTSTTMVGLLDGPLRDVMQTLRFVE